MARNHKGSAKNMMKYIICMLEDIEKEFYHKIEKRNEQIRELQETIKKQGQIIEKLKTEMKNEKF